MNPQRGEYAFDVEGVGKVTLRLSMKALAQIESNLETKTVGEMIGRLQQLGIRDLYGIIEPMIDAGGNDNLAPFDQWPPDISAYTQAVAECMFASGFLNRPDPKAPASPNEQGQ